MIELEDLSEDPRQADSLYVYAIVGFHVAMAQVDAGQIVCRPWHRVRAVA